MIRWAIYLKSALHAFSLSNPESVEVYLAFMYFWKLSQVVHCPFSHSCLANADRTVAIVHCIAVSILVLSSSGPILLFTMFKPKLPSIQPIFHAVADLSIEPFRFVNPNLALLSTIEC